MNGCRITSLNDTSKLDAEQRKKARYWRQFHDYMSNNLINGVDQTSDRENSSSFDKKIIVRSYKRNERTIVFNLQKGTFLRQVHYSNSTHEVTYVVQVNFLSKDEKGLKMVFTTKGVRLVKNRTSEMFKYNELMDIDEDRANRIIYAHQMLHTLDEYHCHPRANKLCELSSWLITTKQFIE